jgi:hypothetical protein
MTDSRSTASTPHTGALAAPVKYSPVMRQNRRPHVVYRASRAATISTTAALMVQATTIHVADATTS